jgi:hypothetical protein
MQLCHLTLLVLLVQQRLWAKHLSVHVAEGRSHLVSGSVVVLAVCVRVCNIGHAFSNCRFTHSHCGYSRWLAEACASFCAVFVQDKCLPPHQRYCTSSTAAYPNRTDATWGCQSSFPGIICRVSSCQCTLHLLDSCRCCCCYCCLQAIEQLYLRAIDRLVAEVGSFSCSTMQHQLQ